MPTLKSLVKNLKREGWLKTDLKKKNIPVLFSCP